ncbi:MAG: ArsA family ATPase [Drouetiella hepatica Uher 2000/2452]|jgi:arsenite-transporting ATPase|uniref:ArsA family ATPase n=1 Tax=Drouetiella hepatica Uher 2000/2452 TaxID=904376 RepID=A0A951UMZ5_9CYAN|nr:ArsA family ATPase [Drouetiella hepatica Uher 2000/2452]
MALVLTFLGKGGIGRTTMAIAAARQLAAQGKRVLLLGQDSSPAWSLQVGISQGLEPRLEPQALAPNLQVMQLQTAALLEKVWEELKKQEAQYLRTPFFKAVYGQELGLLPGMDHSLALNAIREYDASSQYDVIIYDGDGNQSTLRMLGAPEIFSWYMRRFRQVFAESDLGKTLSPFLQPIAASVLNVSWTGGDVFNQPAANQATNLLDQGRAAIANPSRVAAYLVTSAKPEAIATAKYLWGSAQQVGLTVGGVLVNSVAVNSVAGEPSGAIGTEFEPLKISLVPGKIAEDWQPLMQSLPDFSQASQAPQPIRIDVAERKVYLFLPGFDKKQVKLTQYGPEVTVEAGDQRRNIFLPPELRGRQVTGAKFHEGYLIVSL